MGDYIDRKAAVAALLGDETVHIPTLLFAQKRIEAIPAADVVEVVRCGECKYWKRIKNDCILASCELDALVRSEDFFCADGAKMEGTGDDNY
jgi:hypothetical protein